MSECVANLCDCSLNQIFGYQIPDFRQRLSGLRWEMPIIGWELTEEAGSCVDPADQVVTLHGDPNTVYQVTLRFRGIVEVKNYIDGMVDDTTVGSVYIDPGPAFFPGNGMFQTGGIVDPDYNPGANEYSLIVSDPPQTYWLNRVVNTSWEHLLHRIDYMVTIPIRGSASVTIRAQSKDNLEVNNGQYSVDALSTYPIYVPGVEPFPDFYKGQFVEMQVISITN